MSAPDTNIDKQARNHWPPLWGYVGVAVFVSLLGLGIYAFGASDRLDEASSSDGVTVVVD